ncbi:MAG: hypothetical protein CEE38_19860 [Planctomycetes bacterium B3_Pla]|nr:MAG: hypothetical protein CEE38_19860 [Planctomycetes bacterium B3_Pla]
MTDGSENTVTKKNIFCNRCRNETNHILKAEHYRDYPDYNPDGSIAFVERLGNRFWVCAGCDKGTLEEFYIFDVTIDDNIATSSEEYFPERTKLHVEDKKFKQLPDKLTIIYRETLRAYNNSLSVLCALGIRALLEGICADKGITGSNLKTRIDNMVSIPLPQNIVINLHSLRFIGNEAAHELSKPTKEELRLAIEICEDLLNYLYELDYKAHQLTSSRKLKETRLKNTK